MNRKGGTTISRRRKIASEQLKLMAAERAGFADKVRYGSWEKATSQEIGSMVGEMIQKGKDALVQQMGAEVADELGLKAEYDAADGWRSFSPRNMFRFAEGFAAKQLSEASTNAPHHEQH